MSEAQIKQILKRLEAQDKRMEAIAVDIAKQIGGLKADIQPVKAAFDSVTGFSNISVWLLKFIALFGSVVGIIWAAIKYLKE